MALRRRRAEENAATLFRGGTATRQAAVLCIAFAHARKLDLSCLPIFWTLRVHREQKNA